MTEYRGRLDGPLSSAPSGLAAEVDRSRKAGAVARIAVVVCGNDHVLLTMLETGMGPVAIFSPSSAIAVDGGPRRFTNAEWVQTLKPTGNGTVRVRCRCTRGHVDLDQALALGRDTPNRRIGIDALR